MLDKDQQIRPAGDAPAEQPAEDAPTEQPADDAPAGEPAGDAPAGEPADDAAAEQLSQDAPVEQPAVDVSTEQQGDDAVDVATEQQAQDDAPKPEETPEAAAAEQQVVDATAEERPSSGMPCDSPSGSSQQKPSMNDVGTAPSSEGKKAQQGPSPVAQHVAPSSSHGDHEPDDQSASDHLTMDARDIVRSDPPYVHNVYLPATFIALCVAIDM